MEHEEQQSLPESTRGTVSRAAGRQRYSPPQLTEYGSILVLTRGTREEKDERTNPPT